MTHVFHENDFAFSASSASLSKTHIACSPLPVFSLFGGKIWGVTLMEIFYID